MKLSTMLLMIIVLISCSKKSELNYTVSTKNGVETIRNKNIPADSSLSINLTELYTIAAEDSTSNDSNRIITAIYSIHVDKEGSVYVLNLDKSNIKKFDAKGKFVTSFGRKGNGPGEFGFCITAEIIGKEIYCNDYTAQKIAIFDTNGKFKRNLNLNNGVPQIYQQLPNGRVVTNFNSFENLDDGVYTTSTVLITDSLFENRNDTLRHVRMQTESINTDYTYNFWGRAVGKNEIYLSRNRYDEYVIDVYDLNGKLKRVISKAYTKVKLDSVDLARINRRLKERSENNNFPATRLVYKKSIFGLFADKNNRLWVESSVEKKNKEVRLPNSDFDIFENGIFLKRVKIDLPKGYTPKVFKNDLIYAVNFENNSIKVFSY